MGIIGKYINSLKLNKKENETICFKIDSDIDVVSINLNEINDRDIFYLKLKDISLGVINDNGSFIMFRYDYTYKDVIEEDYQYAEDFLK